MPVSSRSVCKLGFPKIPSLVFFLGFVLLAGGTAHGVMAPAELMDGQNTPSISTSGDSKDSEFEDLNSVFLFNTGAPVTNPYSSCGSCYAWSSTFYNSPTNYDLTGRSFSVTPGSMATSFRIWWAYGDDGPHPNNANQGGQASDFARISLDLYDTSGPGGAPGALLANLTGSWVVLNTTTNYREYQLDAPYVFTGNSYYISMRAETAQVDYQATVLWYMCATHDAVVDYETYLTGLGNTVGWRPYTELNPCPVDQDFGLQVVGLPAPSVTEVNVTPTPGCLTNAAPCNLVTFTLNRMDTTPVRGYSVRFSLDSHLTLCTGLSDITEGPFLQDYCGSSCTHFEVTPNLDGSYTVDCVILGGACGPTTSGTLFYADLGKAGPEGTGTVTIQEVILRDCVNQPIVAVPGLPASITVDTVPPDAVANLTATQMKTGNDADGTTKVTMTFSPPGDASTVEVYRAGYGQYPEYDDAGGAVPSTPSYPPGAPWVLTGVTASGQADEASARDFYYYVVFTKDACGNVSAVSNKTMGTLNYHLGDVTPPPGGGDNEVEGLDISELGAHYGGTYNPAFNYLDVGPTTDYSVNARPTTDNVINFEDLVMFAINFGTVSFQGEMPTLIALGDAGSGAVRLDAGPIISQVRAGQMVDVPVVLRGAGAHVQGIKTVVGYDPAVLSYQSSEVSGTIGSTEHFFKDLASTGQVELGLALLGHGASMEGEGPVAVLHFRALRNGPAVVRLTGSSVRDTENRELLGQAVVRMTRPAQETVTLPTQYVLGDARPNPFNPKTVISYELPQASQVQLVIYDVAGRVVRTLVDGQMPAGSHGAEWDGRDDGGRPVGSGIYFYAMRAGAWQSQKRLTLLK